MPLILRDAFRHVARLRPSSLAAGIVLALGIGAGAVAFALLDTALLQRLPFPHADRLVQIWSTDPRMGVREGSLAFEEFRMIASRTRAFEEVGFSSLWLPGAAAQGQRAQVNVARISPNLFDVLGIVPAVGKGLPNGSQPFIVLSHALAERLYGAADRVPESVVVLDGRPYVPVGIMPRGFSFPADTQAWVSAATREPTSTLARDGQVVARLAAGVTLAEGQTDLVGAAKTLAAVIADWPTDGSLGAVALQEQVAGPVRNVVLVLFAAVILFFLIAVASAGQLLFVENLGRRREWAIRTALGASRRTLIAQLFVESLFLAAVATAGGALLAAWLVGSARGLIPASVPRLQAVSIHAGVVWFMIALGAVAALMVAGVSALRVLRSDPAQELKQAHRPASRALLLGLGTAALVVLTMSAVSLTFGLWKLTRVDLGFEPAGVLTARLCPPETGAGSDAAGVMLGELRRRIGERPGVYGTAVSDQSPVGGHATYEILLEGVEGYPEVRLQSVSGDYFALLGIPILEGRAFDLAGEGAPGRRQVAIVNKAFRDRFWQGTSAVGQRLQGSWSDERDWIEVVGMSADVRRSASDTSASPLVFVPFAERAGGCGHLLMKTHRSTTAAMMRAYLWESADGYAMSDITSLEAVLRNHTWQARLRAWVIGGFAVMALVFGAVALYTTLAQLVSARRKELAIRAALGARRGALARVVLASHAVPIAAGLVAGAATSFAIGNSVRASIYGFEQLDTRAMAAAFMMLALTALAATIVPAIKAEYVDVVPALRNP